MNEFSGRFNNMCGLQVPITGYFGITKTKIGRLKPSYAYLKNQRLTIAVTFAVASQHFKA